MRSLLPILLIASLGLTGCEKVKALAGIVDQKGLDASAIGYACRVSLKVPEDCMKENEAASPTAILTGWKSADKDIHDGVLDPSMGKTRALAAAAAAAAAAAQSAPVAASAPEVVSTPEAKSSGKEKVGGKEKSKHKTPAH
jgi:hypothetical protein